MSRRKIIITIGILLCVAIFIPIVRHYQLRAATQAYIAQLKAKGEPMELAQVIPPPVPPEQNSADIFRAADALFNKSFHADKSDLETNFVYGMRMVAPGKAMIRWQQPDIRDIDGTNSWENVAAAVVQNVKAFALLQQIIEKPTFGFSIKYDQGVADLNFTNFYLSESKRSALRLQTAALCALHQGDTALAIKNLRAMLALVKAMRDERLVISELVRIAIAQIAFTVNWELLQSPNLTDKQLTELQHDWENLKFIQSFENALEMERVSSLISANQWRKSSYKLQSDLESWTDWGATNHEATTAEKAVIRMKVFMWQNWWSYPDELQMLKSYQILLETTRSAKTNEALLTIFNQQKEKLKNTNSNKFDNIWDFWEIILDHDFDVHKMLSGGMMSLPYAFNKVISAEAAKQITVTAITLKRYQLKHGNYPADLNSLVPEFISTVPLDPVDGQPLRYRKNADGTFLLYSVGENGVDDGGDPSLEKGVTSSNYSWQNIHALDWVWPQPATEAEIQAYHKKISAQSN